MLLLLISILPLTERSGDEIDEKIFYGRFRSKVTREIGELLFDLLFISFFKLSFQSHFSFRLVRLGWASLAIERARIFALLNYESTADLQALFFFEASFSRSLSLFSLFQPSTNPL